MSDEKQQQSPSFKVDPNGVGQIISGKAVAAQVRAELKEEVAYLSEKMGATPKVAVVLVGDRGDSATYVRMKTRACEAVGILSEQLDRPADITQQDLEALIDKLNSDSSVDGILVQLPLPKHIDTEAIIGRVSAAKDVDGLHQENVGKLVKYGTKAPFIPCTPLGCIELLDRSGVEIEGKQAVVVGRSMLVGIPVAQLLLHRNATVTVCHSRTKDLGAVVRTADIVVAAAGRPGLVKGEWIKKGAVVLDVGTSAVDDPSRKRGYRLVGDVEFDEAKKNACALTPVPGGVGPMTVAMLLKNTVSSFKAKHID